MSASSWAENRRNYHLKLWLAPIDVSGYPMLVQQIVGFPKQKSTAEIRDF
jgi:hypothetical protein